MTLEEFGSRLKGAKPHTFKEGKRGYRACCPAHDDDTPSFAVWEGIDGWLHVKCQRGCSEQAILGAMGLVDADRRLAPMETVEYVYRDEDGTPLFKKVRYYKNGKKQFFQTGMNGERDLSHLGTKAKTMYNAPEVLSAIAKGETIWLNEGEKACESFKRHGLTATCQPAGADEAADSKWLPMHTRFLSKAKDVVIVADRDRVGEVYARYVAEQLRNVGVEVRIVQSLVAKDKADAYDHFLEGFAADQFVPFEEKQDGLNIVVFGEDFRPVEPTYLIEPYFPEGKMVLIDGDGGTGKSSWILSIAAAMSNGWCAIGKMRKGATRTLYLYQDSDRAEEYETVYRGNGGKPGGIAFYNGQEMLTPAFADQVIATIKAGGFGFVVFDPLLYYFAGLAQSTDKAIDVLPGCRQANRILEATGASGAAVRHTTKSKKDKAASDLGIGSVQFRNSFRGQIVLRWHPEEKGVVVGTDEKGSILVQRGKHFCFKRIGLSVEYVEMPNPFGSSEGYEPQDHPKPWYADKDEDPFEEP